MTLGSERLEGVSDARGEILWEDIAWEGVRIFPSPINEVVALEEGRRNEHVLHVEASFRIQGVVVDPNDRPVPGAEIWTSVEARTSLASTRAAIGDADGSFSLVMYEVQRTDLFARASGRAPSRVNPVGAAEGGTVTVRLVVGDAAGALEGDVVTKEGHAIQGAQVWVRGSTAFLPPQDSPRAQLIGTDLAPNSRPQRTGADGAFRFADVPVGEASVMVRAQGWAGRVERVDVEAGTTSRLRVFMGKGARLVGRVLDTENRPLQGVTVEAYRHDFASRTSVSDRDGRYVLEHVQPGFVMLEAFPLGRERVVDQIELGEGEEGTWNPVFSAGAAIEGVLLDHEGIPVANTVLRVTAEDGTLRGNRTDAEGRFSILHCLDQEYDVSAYLLGLRPFVLAKGIRPGGDDLVLRLPAIPEADAYIVGRVLGPSGEHGFPVEVSGRGTEFENFAGGSVDVSDGSFRLGPLLPGTWSLQIHTTAFPAFEREVTVSAGETNQLGEVRLAEPVPVEVTVREPGSLRGSITAQLWGPGFEGWRMRVDRRVPLPPLQAGHYRLEIAGESVPREVREFELVNGRETRIEIELRAGVSRSLEVVLPEGMDSTLLQFTTFDSAGRELVSWRRRWYSQWGPTPHGFRAAAVRIVATTEDGLRAEGELGSSTEIRLELR